MFNISEELKKLPQQPGVYIMKDEKENIIYVGKAIHLRNRVRSYFRESNQDPKVRSMVPCIKEFEYIVTDNELEALILECNLIKKHTPKYNINLKDNKTYPYIKVTKNEAFPKVILTRQHNKDKAKYYGPYPSIPAIRETIDVISKVWKLRTCDRVFPRDINKQRPCLNYHIGKCLAPCNGSISEEQYNKIIEEVILFLNGKSDDMIKKMKLEMQAYSDQYEFEKAAEVRDKIIAIEKIHEKQKINNSFDDQDIISFARKDDQALFYVFFIRGGKMIGSEHFMLNKVLDETDANIMTEFIKQFYSETSFIPKEIIIKTEIIEKELILLWLSEIKGHQINIVVPQKGEKHKLIRLADTNAQLNLEQFGQKITRENQRTIGALEEIQNALGITKNLERIEAYDISNTQGFQSVGSMVVFDNGKPKRSEYRKFKIKGVFGPNDYASMEEVISRRFIRYKNETAENTANENTMKFNKLPDLIFIDGGIGHVHVAIRVLKELDINVPVCGLVKDDLHRTRGLIFNEIELNLKPSSEGFKLITRIQDEVHRFAIEYHRKLREKTQIHSVLNEIKGIGTLRRKALMMHFGSIEKIRDASLEELSAAPRMNVKIAKEVYNFFNVL